VFLGEAGKVKIGECRQQNQALEAVFLETPRRFTRDRISQVGRKDKRDVRAIRIPVLAWNVTG
jgi:hypothetical protein